WRHDSRRSGRPIGGDADGVIGRLDRGLVACYDRHAEALHQQWPRLNSPEVGAGDEQQITGLAGQLPLCEGDDLRRRHAADAKIVGYAETGDVPDRQTTPLQPGLNRLVELVDIRRKDNDAFSALPLDRSADGVVGADDRSTRLARNTIDERSFAVGTKHRS